MLYLQILIINNFLFFNFFYLIYILTIVEENINIDKNNQYLIV